MKFIIYSLFIFTFIFSSCNNSLKVKNNDNYKPNYNEFTVEDSVSDYSETVNDTLIYDNKKTENQTFELSNTNLNQYLASSEQTVLFSFKTQSGKTLSFLTDKDNNYIIYRYGTPSNIELQYPTIVDQESWQKFFSENYKSNSTFLMHIQFNITGYKYNVYYNKFNQTPENNKIGVQVTSTNGKKVDIRGKMNTLYGDINYFRNSSKIRKIPLN